ncbi:DUF7146 domain-containing protein [Chelatococcus reniformis]|uniref:Zinc finger CHC2-type domain-containing protein n=1 Tax=Chelatococcus reniformis TaxID=1494448 RepID=A0A916UWR6_9HYPH|nr:CHC2 zinc finger domain-containing protein [Chelatococcus reniformis]GGC90544.1 hypothetical protein GCM10010994_55450 [Chelatococcus reniformis]
MAAFSPDQIDELKQRASISQVFERAGFRLRGAGNVRWCLSPFNAEKTPSCKVDEGRGSFYCFSSGQSGDVVDAIMHFRGVRFREAVEQLGGVQPVSDDERAVYAQRCREQREREAAEAAKTRSAVERMFAAAAPIAGTHAEAYFRARGLECIDRMSADLRFAPRLRYQGFRDEDDPDGTDLGEFPAVLAAIRDVDRAVIGIHRTYLDPERPAKLRPPGDQTRNKAKKVFGKAGGGLIWLSPMAEKLAMGEGIETSQSAYELGLVDESWAIASAVSLGNLAGGSTGTVPHPTRKRPDGKPYLIPNGEPDHDRPGVILPDQVEEVRLLGDGDSEQVMTRARLVVAGRRFRELERRVFVSMAPVDTDWNDQLQIVRRS